jgi:hypothetical protein
MRWRMSRWKMSRGKRDKPASNLLARRYQDASVTWVLHQRYMGAAHPARRVVFNLLRCYSTFADVFNQKPAGGVQPDVAQGVQPEVVENHAGGSTRNCARGSRGSTDVRWRAVQAVP